MADINWRVFHKQVFYNNNGRHVLLRYDTGKMPVRYYTGKIDCLSGFIIVEGRAAFMDMDDDELGFNCITHFALIDKPLDLT